MKSGLLPPILVFVCTAVSRTIKELPVFTISVAVFRQLESFINLYFNTRDL